MIFRKEDGMLVEINRFDYKNDYLYYKKVLELKHFFSKSNQMNNSYNYSNYIINKIINI